MSFKKAGAFSVAFLLSSCARGTPYPSDVRVGPATVVAFQNADREHHEMLADADPDNPARMMVCAMSFSGAKNAIFNDVALTQDGGKHWHVIFADEKTPFVGDPACAYAKSGDAYYSSLSFGMGVDDRMAFDLYRSRDRGETWKPIAVRPFIDREFLTFDRKANHGNGLLYFYGSRGYCYLELGRVAGDRFLGSTFVRGIAGSQHVLAGRGVLAASGALVIPFFVQQHSQWHVGVARSSDGGKTLVGALLPGKAIGHWDTVPDAAIDSGSSAFRNRIYFTWNDNSSGKAIAYVATSADEGKTWSDPMPIHIPLGGEEQSQQFVPNVAVNKNGIVAASWYDTRFDSSQKTATLVVALSHDGGETFDESFPIANATYDPSKIRFDSGWARTTDGGASSYQGLCTSSAPRPSNTLSAMVNSDNSTRSSPGGDTRSTLADSGGVFHLFWNDDRTGYQDLYTASLQARGGVSRNGDARLAALRDATKVIFVRYVRSDYDAQSGTLTLAAVLVNRSKTTLHAPIVLRLLSVRSDSGTMSVQNAVNGRSGPGAYWDFSRALSGGTLPARSESESVTMVFHLEGLGASRFLLPGVTMQAKVLSR